MHSPDSGVSDRVAVQQLFDRYLAAFHAEDLATLRSTYTDDALLMAPGPSVVRGVEAIIDEWYRPMFEAFAAQMDLSSEELQVDSAWGFNRGIYVFRLTPRAGGEPVEERGKYLDVVQRSPEGNWLIARAIWNSEQS